MIFCVQKETSEDSIKYCVAFLVCRFLDEDKCTKLGIPEKYSFNNLIKEENNNTLTMVYIPNGSDCLVKYLITKLSMGFLRGFKIQNTTIFMIFY